MPNLLIFIPSPRDDPEFELRVKKLKHDKLWFKYHPYIREPYNRARKFFMKHREYSHFAICPDDLMVTEEGVERLWKNAKHFDILMGTCNVDMNDDGRLAMTKNLPTIKRDGRVYDFYNKSEVGKKIIQVPWCGTPFAIFSRKIMGKMMFNGDGRMNPDRTAFSYDVGIAHDAKKLGVAINVDTGVYFHHKRFVFPVLVGEKPTTIWWDQWGKPRQVDGYETYISLHTAIDAFRQSEGSGKIVIDNLLREIADFIVAIAPPPSIIPE
jgi:hypothetical protein